MPDQKSTLCHADNTRSEPLLTTRKVEYPELDRPSLNIWQAISLANQRLTGCWKSKIIGGACCAPWCRTPKVVHNARSDAQHNALKYLKSGAQGFHENNPFS